MTADGSPTHDNYRLYGCYGGSWEGAKYSLMGINLSMLSILTNGLGTTDECDIGFIRINKDELLK